MNEVADRGLQAERTLLAWRRTSLAIAVASVFAARYMADAWAVVALGLLGGTIALVNYFLATALYRRRHMALTGSDEHVSAAPAVATLACALLVVGLFSGALILHSTGIA